MFEIVFEHHLHEYLYFLEFSYGKFSMKKHYVCPHGREYSGTSSACLSCGSTLSIRHDFNNDFTINREVLHPVACEKFSFSFYFIFCYGV